MNNEQIENRLVMIIMVIKPQLEEMINLLRQLDFTALPVSGKDWDL